MIFIAATGNRHKLEEIKRILAPMGHDAVLAAEAGIRFEAEETGSTFEENAMIKALTVASAAEQPCIADDSGLEVFALGGRPGIYSARYAGPGATDADRIGRLLGELAGMQGKQRAARFVCALCCVFPGGRSIAARGECMGAIAREARGRSGFGYDPVFIEDSTGKTFAELTDEEKDAVSHRGRALRDFEEKLKQYLNGGEV